MAPRIIKLLVFSVVMGSCTKDKGSLDALSGYPKEVAEILLGTCATSGCHTAQSKEAAGGLSLATWRELFEGGRNGPVVIPYRPDFSTLCFYTNTFTDLGPALEPTMPVNGESLGRENVIRLFDWISEGAQDNKGNIRFAGQPFRRKSYVTSQLCDLVIVLDAETRLPMRYVDVGVAGKNEFPVCVKVSPEGNHWYVSFLASTKLEKYDAVNDRLVGSVDLGAGLWSGFVISQDSRTAYCVDQSAKGKVTRVDLELMKVTHVYESDLVYPRSIVMDRHAQVLYVGSENGNYITKIDVLDPGNPVFSKVILDGDASAHNQPSLDPNVLFLDEQSGFCFAGCVNSKELRIVDLISGGFAGKMDLPAAPTFMAMDEPGKRLFISCMNDTISFPGHVGSVLVANPGGKQIISVIKAGFQPTGICMDLADGYALVVNSNISPKGPAPHHSTGCAGRNGYATFIDLATLRLLPEKYELAVYPYAADFRR